MKKDPVKACVIGFPVSHSKSPLIHQHWIQKYGLSGNYDAKEVSPDALGASIENLVREGYSGFNVTLPHKQAMVTLCDVVDDTARAIGAVNTVVIQEGQRRGTNTDAFGYIENLKSHKIALDKTKPAIVLGAGGAARAIVYGLLQDGFESILITNRTYEKAQELVAMNPKKIKALSWDAREDALAGAGLLVNTTALGMTGKDPLLLNLSLLPKTAVVSDIVYAPLMTELLQSAQRRGNSVVTGIGMLLHQARPAFAAWFGVLPEVDEVLEKKVLG